MIYITPYNLDTDNPLTYTGPYTYFSYGNAYNTLSDSVDDYVNHLITSGSSVIAVGRFTAPHSHIARFDGSAWQDTKGGGEFFARLTEDARTQSGMPLAGPAS